jgi:ligand-binding SRPBCC domain-containing protein
VPFPVERVFLFFANPENLPRLMPPMTRTRIDGLGLVAPPPLPGLPSDRVSQLAGVGTEIDTSFRVLPYLPFRARWIARITEFEWNHHFADIQVKGPFRSWHHRHEMTAETRDGITGTIVRDCIEYELGFGGLGDLALRVLSAQIAGTFKYRQRMLSQLLLS